MIAINIVLALLLASCSFAAAVWAVKNRRSFHLNQKVAADLDSIIADTLKAVQASKKLSAPAIEGEASALTAEGFNMQSPEMLATLVTVLVHRYGDVRLSMNDFMISDEAYVSVYVDTTSQEIVLSMNSELSLKDSYSIVNYGNNDDNTFH